jgi:hypothetical protein
VNIKVSIKARKCKTRKQNTTPKQKNKNQKSNIMISKKEDTTAQGDDQHKQKPAANPKRM